MQLNLWVVAVGFGAVQGYFLAALFLAHDKGYRRANRLLATLLLVMALVLTEFLVIMTGQYVRWPHLIFATAGLWYLIGPLFYFYFKALLSGRFRIGGSELLHGIPFVVVVVGILMPFYGLPPDLKVAALEDRVRTSQEVLFDYGVLVQMVIYGAWSFRLVHRFEALYKHQAAATRITHLRWIKLMLGIIAVYVLVRLAASVLPASLSIPIQAIDYIVILSFLIHVVAYVAIRQPERLFPGPAEAVVATSSPEEKYQTSSLKTDEARHGLAQLLRLMDTEKPYLNSELKLADLAVSLRVSTHHISQIINQEQGVNFYEFINGYRVREAQVRLVDPAYAHMTVLAIGLDVGFNSKSSFNRVFKRCTGMSPSAYKAARQVARLTNGQA